MNHAQFNLFLNWKPTCYQLQGRWTFNDSDGNQWPLFYKTRREAEAMAARHKDVVLERVSEE